MDRTRPTLPTGGASPPRTPAVRSLMVAVVLALTACGADGDRAALGPADGHDLPPADTGRVAVGDPAPDFTLESYAGPAVRLSDFRGDQEVLLVFYRGHW